VRGLLSRRAGAVVAVVAAAALAGSLAACGGSGPAGEGSAWPSTYPGDYSTIVEASRTEGPLDIYGTMSEEDMAPLVDGFHELYPWVEVRSLDLGTNEIFERYYAEESSGAGSADLIISPGADGWARFLADGKTAAYTSPELGGLPEWSKQWTANGMYVFSVDPYGLVVNKSALAPGDAAPTSFAELGDLVARNPGAYAGKVATYSPKATWLLFWDADRGLGDGFWSSLSKISDLRTETSGGAAGEKLLTGEYAIGMMFPLSAIPPQAKDRLEFVAPTDNPLLAVRGMGITGKADSPNSARLFLDFALSAAGQRLVAKTDRVPYREDVAADVEAAGEIHYDDLPQGAPLGPDPKLVDPAEFQRILGRYDQAVH
jgi:iron(III) transport system substrate-binding protein